MDLLDLLHAQYPLAFWEKDNQELVYLGLISHNDFCLQGTKATLAIWSPKGIYGKEMGAKVLQSASQEKEQHDGTSGAEIYGTFL